MNDNLLALYDANDVFELRTRTAEAFSDIGFRAAYYIAPLSLGGGAGQLMTNQGFPEDWEAQYRAGLDEADPIPGLALSLARPVIWNRLPAGTQLPAKGAAYLESLSEWDMEAGVGMVAFGPSARVGFVGVGFPKTREIGEYPDTARLQVTAQISFLRYCQLIETEIESLPALSERELDVLNRIAQGKSKITIARDLGVSKDTVDTYFRRIYAKLDVSERGAAVAAAVARGIIVASDMRISDAMLRRQQGRPGKGGSRR
ncbi:LuxR family transcriptional regulator [Henriciella sp.]|uniref:helix-turn-helix transcriptional regulator n=1 Tax=Henriciella sp. TaxID=1968823 RepID=UPI0026329FB9|nr:LuxR family transcriptional regulator [Henriciella sp.]